MKDIKNNKPTNIDELMRQVLNDNNKPIIPINFADKLAQKFNIRNMKRRLFAEWGMKLLIIIAVTTGFTLTFFLTGSKLLATFISNYYPIILIVTTIAFIFFFDQVLLKLMFFLKEIKNNKSK